MATGARLVRVQTADFDLAEEYSALRRAESKANTGAIVTFVGLVREFAGEGRRAKGLFLQHYPGMTERLLGEIVDEARQRWDLNDLRVIHRVGQLAPTDQIVFVGVCSAHRAEAFAAAQFIMDYLKIRATFWKKETSTEGNHWVDARQSDRDAASRWQTGD